MIDLVDALGQRHQPIDLTQAPPRIVSLVPSLTELVCELGLAPLLVGRTGFCIHPRETLRTIAKVGGTKDVNIERIRELAPTHLIVNMDENEKPTVETLAQFIPHVIVTHPLVVTDNPGLYRLIGGIFHAEARAEQLCTAFDREYAAVRAMPSPAPQTVLYCIWKDPWMTISRHTYIADMLRLVGWQCWTPDGRQDGGQDVRYPKFAWSDAVARQFDRVLLSTEPYRFTEAHVDALEQQVGKPVQLVDGEMLSWYGSRAIRGLAYLRQLAAEG